MNGVQGMSTFTCALVHPSTAQSPLERFRHESFIAQKLTFTFAALALAPFFLAFNGAPTIAEVLVFACALVPLGTAMLVARTGRIVLGHLLAFCSLIGISLTLFIGVRAGPGCALAWLIVSQFEAALSGDRRLTGAAAIVTSAILGAIIVATWRGWLVPSDGANNAGLIVGFALVYAILIAQRSVTLGRMMRRREEERVERWQAVSEALHDAVIGCEADGSVCEVPAERGTLFGLAGSDLMGRGLFEQIHVADRPAFLKLVDDAAHGRETDPLTFRLRTWTVKSKPSKAVEAEHLWIEMQARGVGAHRLHHAPGNVVAILRDVTAMRERARQSEDAQKSTQEAICSRDHFLANMSHELRTPLNAIIGFSDMLSSRTLCPADAEKRREYARIINQSGQHLLSVVNSILDMSKIQSGTFSLSPEPFDAVSLIDLCCDMMALTAREGRVRLVRDYPDTIEEMFGDKRACKQILINLLSNAIKFTPEFGCVTIRARTEGTTLALVISDTGIGIEPADLAKLGDPFFQATSSLSREFEGTGLGLSVVRGLVGLCGGTIAIESDPTKGTCVSVRLPFDGRVVGQRADTAKIETTALRQSFGSVNGPMECAPEWRMKQRA